jgi:hypothetical protein
VLLAAGAGSEKRGFHRPHIEQMQEIEDFSDERNKSWCIHCGQWLALVETNKDHVPSKSLLRKPHPHHLPVAKICKQCNSNFSRDEQYLVALLSSVLAGSTDPTAQRNASAARSLARSPELRARIERSGSVYKTMGGEKRIVWKPELHRVSRVIVKNARGHAFFELGEPMVTRPSHVWAYPLESMTATEREDFEGISAAEHVSPWPEVGSRMMPRVLTGQDMAGPWVVVQQDVYRYLWFDRCFQNISRLKCIGTIANPNLEHRDPC